MNLPMLKAKQCRELLSEAAQGYGAEEVPMKGYLTLLGLYAGVFGGLYLLSGRKPTSAKLKGADLAFVTIASYKLSRIITMSFIGSPFRAPFTKRGVDLKGGEVQDESRGEGLQKAAGNLLTCPFCFNVWSASTFVHLYSIAPKLTGQFARILTIAAAGDVLHHGYRTLRERSE